MKRADSACRLVVFDWDGTLRDSVASIVGCALESLAELNLASSPEAVRATIGLGLRESISRWVDDIDSDTANLVVERYGKRWVERWHGEANLFPGVPEMLRELADSGLLLAVGTGKSRAGLRRDLASVDIAGLFAATRTADETAAKPSPLMLLELMSELGAQPAETLVVGDTTHDLLMAANAGVRAVGVLGGAMERHHLAPHALACLDRVTELPGWLSRRQASEKL